MPKDPTRRLINQVRKVEKSAKPVPIASDMFIPNHSGVTEHPEFKKHTHDASDVVSGTFADSLVSESSVTQHQTALTITESQISDLSHTTEVNDLSASVTWANVPDANITESSVTQHQGALSITESQISDLSHTPEGTAILSTGEVGGTKFLREDGDGTCSWQTPAGGGGSPGGSDTQVQFNDSSSFGGDAGLTYNKTTDILTVVGGYEVTPASDVDTNLLKLNVTGTPTLSWDESDDEFDFSKGVDVTGKLTASSMEVAGNITHEGDTNTYMAFTADQIDLYAGGVRMITCDEAGTDQVVINENSADVNFRVESNGNSNMLFVDGGTNTVSIATSGSYGTFHTDGSVSHQIQYLGSSTSITTTSPHTTIATAPSGAITLTLPSAASANQIIFRFKKYDGSANAVNIARAGSDTIDGATVYTLGSQYDAVTIQADAANAEWQILSSYP